MISPHVLYRAFDAEAREFSRLPEGELGKIYVDLPHRYFSDIESLKEYTRRIRDIGANVLLLLPHFFPSFSEYVVKDYERPAPLFGTWKAFGEYMAFVKDLGMDRMIDIPFNHADWQAEHLKRNWFTDHENHGVEAGADDTDADDNRVRINWGAFILDNGNPELLEYWLNRVLFPHIEEFHVNAVRIDAAWGLDREGLKTIIQRTKERFPEVWFLAENLGMARLIELAESGLAAGAERYFNNMYWYTGGRYIPSDVYRFQKQSDHRPTCTLYSSHDVLMPAMRSLSWARTRELGSLNDKALHRKVVEWDRLNSLAHLSIEERETVVRLMKLDFLLAAFMSTDLMWVAGSERGLLERVNVLTSGPLDFSRGLDLDLAAFMTGVLRAKASDALFNSEGVIIPFGGWQKGQIGLRGYVKRVGERLAMVAVNTDAENPVDCPVPARLKEAPEVYEITLLGSAKGFGAVLKSGIQLQPGQGIILFT